MVYGVNEQGECFKKPTHRMKFFYLCGNIETELGFDICNADSSTLDKMESTKRGFWYMEAYANPKGVIELVMVMVSKNGIIKSGLIISVNDSYDEISKAFDDTQCNFMNTDKASLTMFKQENPNVFKIFNNGRK